MNLDYKVVKPTKLLADFVESFWMLYNPSDSDEEIVVLPDGRIDLIFFKSATDPFQIAIMGIGTLPDQTILPSRALLFTISFKPLAVEYIFHNTVANLLNKGQNLSADFWDFNAADLNDFDLFCKKAAQKIQLFLPKVIDNRKQELFELIYASKGSLRVKELSEKVHWSSRQINRYFNRQYGISLKTYCNILRFRVSLEHIAHGKIFPEENFADQTHFIKEIKKFAGAVPKELFKNKNDRFVLLSTLRKK